MKARTDDLFQPRAALWGRTSRLFAGRQDLLNEALYRLDIPGSTALIFGDRGVGKTSLGWQLFEYLSNLGSSRSRHPSAPRLEYDYECFWIECSRFQQDNLTDVLFRLFRKGQHRNRTFYDSNPEIFDEPFNLRIKASLDLPLGIARLRAETTTPNSPNIDELISTLSRVTADHPFELFAEVVEKVKERSPEKELVIFLDEFDRLNDRTGIGDLIKHVSGVRFVIIGVAETTDELVSDHPSSIRKIIGSQMRVPPLDEGEVSEIFERASSVAKSLGAKGLFFNDGFKHKSYILSGGFPFIPQMIGYNAVRRSNALSRAFDDAITLDETDADEAAVHSFSAPHTDEMAQYKIKIQNFVRGSDRRARLLITAAREFDGWFTEKQLRQRIPENDQGNFANNFKKLVKEEIFRRGKSQSTMFAEPLLRLFVLLGAEYGLVGDHSK